MPDVTPSLGVGLEVGFLVSHVIGVGSRAGGEGAGSLFAFDL